MNARNRGSEWAGCAAVVRHALNLYASGNGNTATWVFGGFASIFAILAYTGAADSGVGFMKVSSTFASLLVLGCWMVLFNSLVQQNAGTGALVPGMGRRSIKVLAVAFCVAVSCLTVPSVFFGRPVASACLVMAIVLILAALLLVRPVVAISAVAAVTAPMVVEKYLMPLGEGVVLGVPLLVGFVAAALAVRALLQGKSTSVMARVTKFDGQHHDHLATAGYAKTLKRDSERRDIPALLLHCLGPVVAQQTVMPALIYALMIGVAIALSIAVPSLATQYRVFGLHVGVPMGIVSGLLTQLYMVVTSVRRTSGEQALVMLSVRRPEAGTLNQELARALILRYGYLWLMQTLMLLTVSAIFGAGAGELAWLLAILLIALTAGSLMLQDYAKAEQGKHVFSILLGLGAVATLLAASLIRISLATGGAIVAVWAALALLCFVLRWKAMMGAPVAFPSRRLT